MTAGAKSASDQRPGDGATQPPGPWSRFSPRYAWYVVVVLMLGYAVSLVDRQILSLMVAPIRHDLGLTDTQLSLLHGLAFAIFYTGFGIPLGWLADHWSRRNLIIGGIACWALATLACGLASNFGELFAARMAVGMGEAALSPAAYSLIHDYFAPGKRGRAMGLYGAGVSLGAGVAYVLGGSVVTYGAKGAAWMSGFGLDLHPWQFVFIAVSLPSLLVMALFATIREPARAPKPPGAGTTAPSLLDGVRTMWADRYRFGPPVLGLSIGSIIFNGLFAWVPSHFIRVYAWTPGQIGIGFGLLLLTFGVGGMWLGGLISDRLAAGGRGIAGATAVVFWGETLGGVAAAIFGWMPTAAGSLAVLSVAVLCFAAAVAVGPVIIQHLAGERIRGQSIAIYLFVVNIFGLGFGPTLIAACSDYVLRDERSVGKAVGLVALVVMPIAAWLLHLTHRRLRPR
jgi:MFS family permease